MTDTGPPTNPGNIDVVGQRRTNPLDGFPNRDAWSGVGEIGGPQGELTGDSDSGGSPGVDPCSVPETRKVWNADAQAAAAVAALVAKADSMNDGSTLSNREFGANLFLNGNGGVSLTSVSVGPTPTGNQIPEVTIEPGGTTYLNWMGDIHNHPSGDSRLSSGEHARFNSRISSIISMHPERAEMNDVSAYVVVADSSSPTGYKIYAHTAAKSADDPGQEVNPNAQSCPNS